MDEYSKDNAKGYYMGCRAMLAALLTVYREGTLKEAVSQLAAWNDEKLIPWKERIEDVSDTARFSMKDFPWPFAPKGSTDAS